MKCAALGIRMHSGWGVLVAVSGDAASLEVLDRRRIVTIDPEIHGSSQPYHHAANLGLPESERYLANCAAISERLAFTAIGKAAQGIGCAWLPNRRCCRSPGLRSPAAATSENSRLAPADSYRGGRILSQCG